MVNFGYSEPNNNGPERFTKNRLNCTICFFNVIIAFKATQFLFQFISSNVTLFTVFFIYKTNGSH